MTILFFFFNINTTKNRTIKLQSRIEGEYAKEMGFTAEVKNDTLYLFSHFSPFYKAYNDKLSAHKVISVEVDLWIPERLNVYAKSNIASARVNGSYQFLTLELAQGNTSITNFKGNAIINSINGDINIETNYASIKTSSKTGTITKELLTLGNGKIRLLTINGNINITKTKK